MNWLILGLCVIWGFNFVIMKLGNDVFSPVMFAALRFSFGTVVLIAVLLIRKIQLPSKRQLKWYVVCGLLQTTYFNIAIQVSLNYISSGLTSVLTYSMPLFLSIMAHYFIPGEKLNMLKMIGISLGIAGLILAMDVQTGGNVLIPLFALSSAVAWALSNVILKTKLSGSNPIQFTAWQMGIGSILLFLYSFSFEDIRVQWSAEAITYLLYSGIIASALAFVIWSYVLSKVAASKASISLLIVPLVGTLCGVIFLKENLQAITIVGIVLVLAGVMLVNLKQSSHPVVQKRELKKQKV
ncbi:DMT family transporter [Terribacillus saccharophilus]|uniref:DMT family transporter n=1 Tax=Terribacillus saccharophilus TaxID=361277 RepID=UPI00398209C8